jgi:hypothetical protein
MKNMDILMTKIKKDLLNYYNTTTYLALTKLDTWAFYFYVNIKKILNKSID